MARRMTSVTALILVFSSAVVFAQTLPAGVKKVASMGGITEYDYSNGLKVLLYPDQSQPKFTVNVTYLVGSRHEGYGETGMAHLLEHMNFIETFSFMDELQKVYQNGFSASELAEARKAHLDARVIGRSTDGSLLTFIAQHEQLDRPYTWDKNLEDKIKSITLDQVNAAFKKHIDPKGLSIVKAGDFKAAKVFQ
jgi:predicted Zn-dependent peptidase